MNKEKYLILFDVDYTLVKGSKIHKESIVDGIKKIFGVDPPIEKLKLHGMTDQQIVTDLLKICGVDKKIIESKMKVCLKAIDQLYNNNKSADKVTLMEGARSLLDEISKDSDFILGLVTGNIESIAYGKLSLVGISQYFSIGGFGSDHIERHKLVEKAVGRAKDKFGIDRFKIFVVGDTPKDINAAKKAGVYSIGIASGNFSREELEKYGADLVLESLLEKDKFIEFIKSK